MTVAQRSWLLPIHNVQVPIFVLSIDSQTGPRRRNCRALFGRLGYRFTFVEGVRQDDPAVRKHYSRPLNLLVGKRGMSSVEVAVYLGHRKAWKALVESGADVALIAEDDLDITDPDAFLNAMRYARDCRAWDVLKLFDFRPKRIVHSQSWNGFEIVDYKYPASGCVAYLITKQAALSLLQRDRIFRPVDEDLSWCWEHGIRVRSVHPNIVVEISDKIGGSTIEPSRLEQKKQRHMVRSIWAMFVQAYKQIRARQYHLGLNR